jgi:hypothetical protein
VSRVNKSEPVEQALVDEIKRDLPARIEIVRAGENADADLLACVERSGVVGVEIVPAITAWILKRPVSKFPP